MLSIRNRIMAALLIIASSLLPGVYADCDLEDGELVVDIEDLCGDGGCDGHDDWDDDDDCHGCDDFDGFDFDFWWDD